MGICGGSASWRYLLAVGFGTWLLGCATDDPSPSGVTGSLGGTSGAVGGATVVGTGTGGTGTNGGAGSSTTPVSNGGTTGTTSTTPSDAIALPTGSRESGHIVNLVDAAAAAEVESKLRGVAVSGMPSASAFFSKYYLDEYDFLFFFADHEVSDATAAAVFAPVYRPAQLATGDTLTIDLRQTHASERLMGVIAARVGDQGGPSAGR